MIFILELAIAVKHIGFEFSFVHTAIMVGHDALAIHFSLVDLALVSSLVEIECAFSVRDIFHKESFILYKGFLEVLWDIELLRGILNLGEHDPLPSQQVIFELSFEVTAIV